MVQVVVGQRRCVERPHEHVRPAIAAPSAAMLRRPRSARPWITWQRTRRRRLSQVPIPAKRGSRPGKVTPSFFSARTSSFILIDQNMKFDSRSSAGTTPLSRRTLLERWACGFGYAALAGLTTLEARGGETTASSTHPVAPRSGHHAARAKRVIFLFMHGGVSHVDSFDPKPKLTELHGKPSPIEKPKFNFAPTGNLYASPWKFQRYGKSGIPVSELFPHVGGVIDDICVIRSMSADFVWLIR